MALFYPHSYLFVLVCLFFFAAVAVFVTAHTEEENKVNTVDQKGNDFSEERRTLLLLIVCKYIFRINKKGEGKGEGGRRVFVMV